MALPTGVARVLRASLLPTGSRGEAERVVATLRSQDLRGLGEAARYHGIPAYVHAATTGLSLVPEDERLHLRGLRKQVVLRHMRTTNDLRHLEQVLTTAGIPWLVIKGPTLAEPVHGAVELRYYGDLDVLVPGRHLGAAMTALERTGAEVLDRNWTLIAAALKGEVHLQLPSGTHLDLHWHLFNDAERRHLFPVDIDGLFARAREVRVSDVPVTTLSLADTVVYVAMHMLHSGGHRLVWLKDVERLLAHPELDPREVASRARTWKGELVLTSALRRVELAFGTPPHAEAIRNACPPARVWSMVARWAWRCSPAESQDGGASLGRIVSRSARRSPGESFRELTRRGLKNLRAGPTRREGHEPSADTPGSGYFEAGGAAGREAFLGRVAREGR